MHRCLKLQSNLIFTWGLKEFLTQKQFLLKEKHLTTYLFFNYLFALKEAYIVYI